MREIKFRGQRVDNKEWIYGSLVITPNEHYAIVIYSKLGEHMHPIFYEVLPETVGQFIGLKDKNEKEIYRGDICSMSKKIDMKIIVDYKDAGFGWSDKYNNLAFRGHGYLTEILKAIEVIGNKFDNPEILEEQ